MAEKEYIEREKAFDALFGQFCASSDETEAVLNAAIEEIRVIPAADVRPVVLCRDCKWTNTDEVEDPAIYCWKWDRWEMPPDGFCWLGKKREES